MTRTGVWYIDHAPRSVEEFVGNRKQLELLISWLSSWKTHRKKGALLVGPPGVGKTTAVELAARTLRYHLIETSASDQRKKEIIEGMIGKSTRQSTLFHRGTVVFFDEVEGISGREDRGAWSAIRKLLGEGRQPLVLATTDDKIPELRAIKRDLLVIKFEKVSVDDIVTVLEGICERENVKASKKALRKIARASDGDVRAAINTLQGMVTTGGVLRDEDADSIPTRDVERELQEALKIIFMTDSLDIAIHALDNISVSLDEALEWIRENVPRVYTERGDNARAMHFVSRSDVFRGRISEQQYYRFMVYQNALMSGGVAVSKTRRYPLPEEFRFPSKIIYLARSKRDREVLKENLKRLGEALHCSQRVALYYIPLLELLKKHDPDSFDSVVEATGVRL